MMPTLFWTDAMFVISQKILGGKLTGCGLRDGRAEVTREVEGPEPRHGRELHDLGQGSRGWAVGRRRRQGSRPRARHAEDTPLDAVCLRAAGAAPDRVRVRLSGRARDRLLDAADPRQQRALRRPRQLPARLRRSDVRGGGEAQRAPAARGPGAARDLDPRLGAALRAGARLDDLPQRPLLPVHPGGADRRDRRELHVHAERCRQLDPRRDRASTAPTGSAPGHARSGR